MLSQKMTYRLKNFGLLAVTLLVMGGWVFSFYEVRNRKVEKIKYSIESVEGARNLINAKELKGMVDKVYQIDILTLPMSKLDINSLEAMLERDDRIYEAEVFIDARQEMHIKVAQRRPIMRIIDSTGRQYYLDQDGNYISKQDFVAVRVPVATGEIEAYNEDWSKKKNSRLKDCFQIVQALRKDEFLTALIEQIHVEKNQIVLSPKMSNERIVIKYLDDLDIKLSNLKAFYQKELARNDSWGKYKEIDISYKNQVIRRPVNP